VECHALDESSHMVEIVFLDISRIHDGIVS